MCECRWNYPRYGQEKRLPRVPVVMNGLLVARYLGQPDKSENLANRARKRIERGKTPTDVVLTALCV
jgi:hypothetical protein